MPIETIITQIAVIQAGISGINQAHDNPPGSINDLPCFVNFIGPSGTIARTASRREVPHSVKMQLYVTRKIDPESEKLLRPFIDKVLDTFDTELSLNGKCQWSMITGYDPGVLTYNRIDYLGVNFDLMVYEQETVSYSK